MREGIKDRYYRLFTYQSVAPWRRRVAGRREQAAGLWLGLGMLAVAAVWMGTAGCATWQAGARGIAEVNVSLRPDGSLLVDEQPVALDALPGRLSAAGAGKDTVIKVHYSPGEPQASFSRVAGILRRAGYERVLFVGPRQVKVSTEPDPRK